jgi:hypothetical protein
MLNLLETNMIAMTTVLLETETDKKNFPRIDFCFSFQASQRVLNEQNGTFLNLLLKIKKKKKLINVLVST